MDRHTRYVAQFHNADDEPVAARAVQIMIDDNVKYSAADYRERLYREIAKKKKEARRARRKDDVGGAGGGAQAGGAQA